jgi:hypothetical protein
MRAVHPVASAFTRLAIKPACEQREEYMIRLLTTFELQRHTASELQTLFRQASQALARSAAETPERRIALASLENISQALAFSLAAGPGF